MLSKNLEISLSKSFEIAKDYGHEFATIEHLLLALIDDLDASDALKHTGADIPFLKVKVEVFIKNDLQYLEVESHSEVKPTSGFQRVINHATVSAYRSKSKAIDGAKVLLEIFNETDSHAHYFLKEQGITKIDISNYLHNTGYDLEPSIANDDYDVRQMDMLSEMSTQVTENQDDKSESFLEKFCVNLNLKARDKKIDVVVGRENEVERTVEILCRRSKNNPIYVGEPGVGKTAVAEGLALKIINGEVPKPLQDATIFSLDIGNLLSGTKFRGDFEERLKNIVSELENYNNAILFIDEIHTIVGAGSSQSGAIDAGNLLKPALARGGLKCIGSTTYNEYQQYFAKDKALARRFQRIDISEPNIEDAIKMMLGLKNYYEEFHGVKYSKEAIVAAVKLSDRYINDRRLPDKAIDLIDEVGSKIKLEDGKQTIEASDIERAIEKLIQMPSSNAIANDCENLKSLKEKLNRDVIGQEEAMESIVENIKMHKAGLESNDRPTGCYLFYGPAGVGKTCCAKSLSQHLNMNYLRIDMSEYSDKHSISKLVGSPPGYVGHTEGGILTNEIYQKPYSLVVFDEIQKADPEIINLITQIMDYGQITDHSGRVINFKNSIVVITSSNEAQHVNKISMGFMEHSYIKVAPRNLENIFSTEFTDKLDLSVEFKELSEDVLLKIIDKNLSQLSSQLKDKNIELKCGSTVKNFILSANKEKNLGIRSIKSLVDRHIKKPLVDEILFGKLSRGGVVRFNSKNKKLDYVLEDKILKISS